MNRGLGPVRRKCLPLMGFYPHMTSLWSSNKSAISRRDWGFLAVRGGVKPKKLGFLPRLVEVFRHVERRRQRYHRVSHLEHRQHASPRSDNNQTVDLGGSDLDDTIISYTVYFRSWLTVRASHWLRREHAADMVSQLVGPGCLIE